MNKQKRGLRGGGPRKRYESKEEREVSQIIRKERKKDSVPPLKSSICEISWRVPKRGGPMKRYRPTEEKGVSQIIGQERMK